MCVRRCTCMGPHNPTDHDHALHCHLLHQGIQPTRALRITEYTHRIKGHAFVPKGVRLALTTGVANCMDIRGMFLECSGDSKSLVCHLVRRVAGSALLLKALSRHVESFRIMCKPSRHAANSTKAISRYHAGWCP
jgi:hypothetical protein